MKTQNLTIGFITCLAMFLGSCDNRKFGSDDEKKIDSLFLGVSFGMEKKPFFDYCWEMNRQKVFTHGPTNQSVQYKLETELDKPVLMQFYPSFHNDRIYEVPALFTYEGWAPWNKELSADILFEKVLLLFKKWYGEDFQKLQHPVQGTVYYQMKGKRRINLFIRDDQFVQAVFTDLRVEKELKNLKSKDH